MARESIELLLFTAGEVIDKGLLKLNEKQICELKDILTDSKSLCGLETIVLVTEYIPIFHPFTSFFETYGKLLEFLLFTYPLLSDQPQTRSVSHSAAIEKLTRALDRKDTDLFAQGYIELLHNVGAKLEHTAYLLQNPRLLR